MDHLTAGHRVDPRRGAPHVAGRVHRVGERAVRHRRRLLDVRLLPARRGPADPEVDPRACPHTTERFVRPSKDYAWSSVVDHMGVEQATGILSGHYRDVDVSVAPLHVVQLHAHRRRDARRRPALRDGGRVGARQRRAHRRGARRGRAALASSTTPHSPRRRPRHGGDRPGVHAATGTSRCAPPASPSGTRATASCTSASDARPLMRRACGRARSLALVVAIGLTACRGGDDDSSALGRGGTPQRGDDRGRRTRPGSTPDLQHDPRPAAGRGHQGDVRARQRHLHDRPGPRQTLGHATAPRCRS